MSDEPAAPTEPGVPLPSDDSEHDDSEHDDSEHDDSEHDDSEHDEFVGMQIGDAVLRRRIGIGGMGLVYEGWQDPPGRLVAVKLLRDALATEEARFRFRHEARILGSLSHPWVADIYSAGTHRAGTEIPYFLMEYIPDALPITQYAAERELPVEDALRLAAKVCRGVQAGHAKGVIHRDLKPDNILVNSEGDPKVIDFGIARATRADEDEATPRTASGQIMGTLHYMSPEQFVGEREAVDTRSDVYALGVILYEMLTGRMPYALDGLGLIEVVETIRKKPPEPPAALRPELGGDVSVILQKALAKDPSARYASAEALADDIERFLERRPILARPPSLTYQFKLYAKRHTAAVAALLGVAVTIVAALVAVSFYAAGEARARAQAEREEARAKLLLHATAAFVPDVADHLDNKLTAIVGTSRVRHLLARKLERLAETLGAIEGASEDPEVAHALGAAGLAVANVRGGIGGASLGEGGAALEDFESAVKQFRRAVAAQPNEPRFLEALLTAQISLAGQHTGAGDPSRALAILAEVQPRLEAWIAREPDSAHARASLVDFHRARGFAHWMAEDPDQSLASYQRALEATQDLTWAAEHPAAAEEMRLVAHLDLATGLAAVGREAEAETHFRTLDDLAQEIEAAGAKAERLSSLWHVHDKLGDHALAAGQLEAAKARHRRALAVAKRLRELDPGDAHARQFERVSRGALGAVLEKQGERKAAAAEYRAVLGAVRAEAERDPENGVIEWDLRVALTRLAATESALGQSESATRLLAEAHEIQRKRVAKNPDSPAERAALGEVESTQSIGIIQGIEQDSTLEQNIEAYERALVLLRNAVGRLAALQEAGTLPPDSAKNLELWGQLADHMAESLEKLKALR